METSDNTYLDNTMLSSYKDCPRKYLLRHVLHWRSEGTSLPLVFGLSWHNGLDVVWKLSKGQPETAIPDIARLALDAFLDTWREEGLPDTLDIEQTERYAPRTPMVALEMFTNYMDARWPLLQSATLVACEQPFAVPMPGLTNVWYIGRLDKVIETGGQTVAVEHKTTTAYKKDGGFRTDYIEGWFNDSQVKGYQFGGSLFFPNLSQVWVDAALVHKQMHNAFRFVPVQHQAILLEEWVADTREWINRVKTDELLLNGSGSHQFIRDGNFPKNENSCMGKYGACPYLNICRTTADPTQLQEVPAGYVVEKWEPFNVLGLDKLTMENTDGKR